MFNSGVTGYSLSDIAAATGNNGNNNDFMGNGAWWIIILFLFVFCGWGNGNWGGNGGGSGLQGALTRADLCQDMNFAEMSSGIKGIQQGICDGFYAQNTNLLNGFAGVNSALTNGFAGVDNAVCTLGYQTQAGINSINMANMQNTNAIQQDINAMNIANMQNANAAAAQLADCCCKTQSNIKDVQYQMATDTCAVNTNVANVARDIIDNQNANTRSILDFIIQDKLSTLQSENQSLRLAASQAAQNQYLVNELRPCPIPAYITCNPYAASYGYPTNGYGYGCGTCA